MADRSYYRVGPAIWLEPWDDDTRYVALYLLTCNHRTTEGYFRLPLEYAIADLKWPARRFQAAFDHLVACEFIAYDADARVCLITKALEWQAPENPNQVKSAMKLVERVPPSPLLVRFVRLAQRHCERLAQALAERFPEPFSEAKGEGVAQPPSPALSRFDPPDPPMGGNGNGSGNWPTIPTGKRKREQVAFKASCSLLAARLFPGTNDESALTCVEQAIRGGARDDDAVRAHAERWFPDLRGSVAA